MNGTSGLALASISGLGWLNPIGVTRAVMMDLGFSGLIEKIEERFGKWLGTLLMGALSLFILVFLTDKALDVFIGTKEKMETAEGLEYYLAFVRHHGFVLIIYILFAFLLGNVFNVWFVNRWKIGLKRLSDAEKHVGELINDAKDEVKKIEEASMTAEKAFDKANKAINEWEATYKRVYGATSKMLSDAENLNALAIEDAQTDD